MNKGLDSTQEFEISGPGGGGRAPASGLDSTQRDVFEKPSPGTSPASHKDEIVSKPETKDVIGSTFYDPCTGNPGTLDSTMEDILQISFGK